jgi:hypothetical protein
MIKIVKIGIWYAKKKSLYWEEALIFLRVVPIPQWY